MEMITSATIFKAFDGKIFQSEIECREYYKSRKEFLSNINWEQRRYEIAKDLYVRVVDYPRIQSAELDAKTCIEYADILIEELRKQK